MLKLEEIIKLRSTPSNTINNVQHHSLTICCLVEFCVCMMMFVFMTLSDSLLCNDCWCIVGLLPAITSVVQLGSSFIRPTSLFFFLSFSQIQQKTPRKKFKITPTATVGTNEYLQWSTRERSRRQEHSNFLVTSMPFSPSTLMYLTIPTTKSQ